VTLAELRRDTQWVWAYCTARGCSHGRPVSIVPYIIWLGSEAPADWLRRGLTCPRCGQRGADLKRPSWADSTIGWPQQALLLSDL
jgi:hypothetical protein